MQQVHASLESKTIVITGGSRGIGFHLAKKCLQDGFHVAICSRTQKEVEQAKLELSSMRINSEQKIIGESCDVSSNESLQKFIQTVNEQAGPIFGAVAAAGVAGPIGPLEELSAKEWEESLRINVMGTFYLLQQVIPIMKRQGRGRIVLFSGGGEGAMPNFTSYVASKGAIWRLCESVAHELAPFNIYVNAIAPGAVDTKLTDDMLGAGREKAGDNFYQKTLKWKSEGGGVSPDYAANLTSYLLAERSSGLYGKILSAVWDPYEKFIQEELTTLSQKATYCMRRVVEKEL